MKNQFFGDESDYKKYGLLRCLKPAFSEGATVCWMLTPDDGTRSCNSTLYRYFDKPKKWRQYDPGLFDSLLGIIRTQEKFSERNVTDARKIPGLETARFFEEVIPEVKDERSAWFERFRLMADGTGLIFFDPDTGMQADKSKNGMKRSVAHLYRDELEQFYNELGYSVLLYQHFWRFKKHDDLIDHTVGLIYNSLKAKRIISFKTSRMVMILIPQQRHWENAAKALPKIEAQWGNKISVKIHSKA